MDRQAWIGRWKNHVAGMLALGHARARVMIVGKHSSAEEFLAELDVKAEQLLRQLYDDLTKQEKPSANGKSDDSRSTTRTERLR